MRLNKFEKNVIELFDRQVVVDRKSEEYLQARFRASGISSHPRDSVLSLLNLPEDKYKFKDTDNARGLKLMAKGTWMHEYIQEKFMNMGILREGDLEEGLRIQDSEYIFSGHPDGVLTFSDKQVLLEIKSINPWGFKAIKEPKIEHYQQAQAYMHFVSKHYDFDLQQAMFIYADRSSDNMDFKTFLVDRNEAVIEMILNKLRLMKEHLDNGTIPAMQPGEKNMGLYSKFNTKQFLDPTKNRIEDFPGYRIIADVKTRNVWE